MTIAEIIVDEPCIGVLLTECEHSICVGWDDYETFKRRASSLVGWQRAAVIGNPELRTCAAYDTVMDAIREAVGL